MPPWKFTPYSLYFSPYKLFPSGFQAVTVGLRVSLSSHGIIIAVHGCNNNRACAQWLLQEVLKLWCRQMGKVCVIPIRVHFTLVEETNFTILEPENTKTWYIDKSHFSGGPGERSDATYVCGLCVNLFMFKLTIWWYSWVKIRQHSRVHIRKHSCVHIRQHSWVPGIGNPCNFQPLPSPKRFGEDQNEASWRSCLLLLCSLMDSRQLLFSCLS